MVIPTRVDAGPTTLSAPTMGKLEGWVAVVSCVVVAAGGTSVVGCSKPDGSALDSGSYTIPAPGPDPDPKPALAVPSPPRAPTVAPDFTTASAYKYDQSNVDSFCTEQWTKRGELDRGMFNYCAAEEKKSHAEMQSTVRKFAKYDWLAPLFPKIWTAWTKRGVTQYKMVAYSLKQQGDGFLDCEFERNQPRFDGAKMAGCASEWEDHDSRWTMTMHCYKQGS